MTKFEKIEQLYQGHNCDNCGQSCDKKNGICERWVEIKPMQGHIHNIRHPPKHPKTGDIIYSESTNELFIYDGNKNWLTLMK